MLGVNEVIGTGRYLGAFDDREKQESNLRLPQGQDVKKDSELVVSISLKKEEKF
jgi:hypothetical protein